MGKGAGNTCDLLPAPLLLLFVTAERFITEVTLLMPRFKVAGKQETVGMQSVSINLGWGQHTWGRCIRAVAFSGPVSPCFLRSRVKCV